MSRKQVLCEGLLWVMVLVAVVGSFALAFIGYQGWLLDDWHYIKGAEGWLDQVPYLGSTHWELRHPIVVPMAIALSLVGTREAAVVGVAGLYYLLLAGVTFAATKVLMGKTAGFLATLLVVTAPLIASFGTNPRPTIAELFFEASALLALLLAQRRPQHALGWMAAAGVMLGLAFVTRETAAGLVGFFGLIWLLGWPLRRWVTSVALVLFACVCLAEMAVYQVYQDDPFYRLKISFSSPDITNSGGDTAVAEALVQEDLLSKVLDHFDFDKIANAAPVSNLVHVNNWLDPYVLIFVEPYYGLVFTLGLPALLFLSLGPRSPATRTTARLLLLVMAVWFVIGNCLLFLRPLPRYYALPVFVAALGLGFFIHWWLTVARVRVVETWGARIGVGLLVLVMVGSNVIFMDARSGMGLYAERRLIDYAASREEVIQTDPTTRAMADFLLRAEGLADRVVAADPPSPGQLYFYDPTKAGFFVAEDWNAHFVPKADWQQVWSHRSEKKLLARLIDGLGAKDYVPTGIYRRLAEPHPPVAIYRLPPEEG